jgi:hypothetical protein
LISSSSEFCLRLFARLAIKFLLHCGIDTEDIHDDNVVDDDDDEVDPGACDEVDAGACAGASDGVDDDNDVDVDDDDDDNDNENGDDNDDDICALFVFVSVDIIDLPICKEDELVDVVKPIEDDDDDIVSR